MHRLASITSSGLGTVQYTYGATGTVLLTLGFPNTRGRFFCVDRTMKNEMNQGMKGVLSHSGEGSCYANFNTRGRFLCVDKFEYKTRGLCQENRPRDTEV